MFDTVFDKRRVLVTGHTGFKGSWLSLWLTELGAEVHGIALEPDTDPSLFLAADLVSLVQHNILDIRERDNIAAKIKQIDPEIVFHLAAQPLVRRSYDQPLETFETNVLGTAYVLDACRYTESTRVIVCVTTDKVYENREWIWPYREIDPLGGKDPYSSSKAAAEIIAACYRQTYLTTEDGCTLATVRGGNVIGGGDWSEDRLVPDLARAIAAGESLTIRNPQASRPWQHVLALCHGYLQLAAGLLSDPGRHQGAWNLGPSDNATITVRTLLDRFGRTWPLPEIVEQKSDIKLESQLLSLDISKARHILGWESPWPLDTIVERTAEWYRAYYEAPSDAFTLMRDQIAAYRADLNGDR